MRKLSDSLKESRFVDLINKKFTGEIRKEDMIGNLQKLKLVDIGTSVLWADTDLCVDKKYLFTFDEVTNMLNGSKWRLPTYSEVRELNNYEKEYRDGKYIFTNNDNGKSLIFYPHGYIIVLQQSKITAQVPDVVVRGWTADVSKYDNNYINTYSIDGGSFGVASGTSEYRNSLLSVRLVKNK